MRAKGVTSMDRAHRRRVLLISLPLFALEIGLLTATWLYLSYWSLIVLLLALFILWDLPLTWSLGRSPRCAGKEAMVGRVATVVMPFEECPAGPQFFGRVRVNGELWFARTTPLLEALPTPGSTVRICAVDGLTLEVEPWEGPVQRSKDSGHSRMAWWLACVRRS